MKTSESLKAQLVALTLVFTVLSAAAQEQGWNEVTIRPADVPRDAPRFETYRSPVYLGPSAPARLTSSVDDQMYRTRIREWSKSKANFAGHYILATWGCGTDCIQITIIDAKTGKVFHPPGLGSIASPNVHDALLAGQPEWPIEGAAKFVVHSSLLVLFGTPDEDPKRRGISYYVWQHDQMKLVRFAPKPWYQ